MLIPSNMQKEFCCLLMEGNRERNRRNKEKIKSHWPRLSAHCMVLYGHKSYYINQRVSNMFSAEDRTCTNLTIGTSQSGEKEGGWAKTSPIYQNSDPLSITRERLESSFSVLTSLKHCKLISSCHHGGQSNKIPTVRLN